MAQVRVQAVLFDFYGTMAEAADWGPTFEDVLAAHGLAVPDDPLWSAFEYDGHEHVEHSQSRDHYVAWERARLGRLAAAAGAASGTVPQLVDDLYRAAKTYELRVYDDVEDAARRLARHGLRLAVCSNWDWDLPDVIDRLRLTPYFEVVVTSARAGARKPHHRIYAHTLAQLGVTPAAAAFVGDSLGPDVEGPLAHGIRAFHLVRGNGIDDTALPTGAQRIASLVELVDALDLGGGD